MSRAIKYFWGVSVMGHSVLNSVFNLYFAFFLTDILALPAAYTSFILLFTSIADCFLILASGAIIDGMKPMRWGKMRSWLLVAPLVVLIFFPMLFVRIGSFGVNAFVITLAYLVFKLFFNFAYSADFAIIPNLARNTERQSWLVSNRMTYSYVGVLLCGYAAPVLINGAFRDFFGTTFSYFVIALCAALIYLLSVWAHFAMSKGYEYQNASKVTLRQMFTAIVKTPSLLPAIISDTASTASSFVLPALTVYYYTHIIMKPALIAIHLPVVSLCGLAGAFFARFITLKLPARTACLSIYPVIAIVFLGTQFVAYNPVAFIVLSAVGQLFLGSTQPVESNLYLDSIRYSEWKTGINARAAIASISGLSPVGSTFIKSVILSLFLFITGYDAQEVGIAAKRGIIAAYSFTPAILMLAAWLSMFFFYKLTPEKMNEINNAK